jgi:uncharacterized protein YtpQ (UPF0354 family)
VKSERRIYKDTEKDANNMRYERKNDTIKMKDKDTKEEITIITVQKCTTNTAELPEIVWLGNNIQQHFYSLCVF